MKQFFKLLSFAAICVTLTIACEKYDDSDLRSTLDDYGRRIAKLETLCAEMNTNLSSLQTIVTALQDNDFVTGVAPYMENGKQIGYTITFSKSGSIVIYNGKDGADGTSASIPVIGLKQDTDGNWYWTADGEWLLDSNGNKVRANGRDGANGTNGTNGTDGANGQNGSDGQNGQDGKDGVTPQLKIENGYWFISYDNGTSWTKLGKATGDNGSDFFKSFSQDSNNVYLTLADGTVITIPKTPKLSITLDVDPTSVVIVPESPVTISYELKNASANPVVTASSDGNFIVSIKRTTSTAGTITIKANDESEDGCVNVIATDESGRSVITVINMDVHERLMFKVSVSTSNSYRASLPLHGEIDCLIDWGDGIVEHLAGTYNGKEWPAAHQYESKASEYIVKVGGKVTWLCSEYSNTSTTLPYQAVTEVVQWGDTELTNMESAFSRNSLLKKIPSDISGVFANVTDFTCAFEKCTALTSIPAGLFANCQNATTFINTFARCSGLTAVPASLFANCSNAKDFSWTFEECTGLTTVPAELFAGCPKAESFSATFSRCTSLTSIPAGIFDGCLKVKEFRQTFIGCLQLKCESPYTVIGGTKVHLYERANYPANFVAPSWYDKCFESCPQLTDYSSIPAGWK